MPAVPERNLDNTRMIYERAQLNPDLRNGQLEAYDLRLQICNSRNRNLRSAVKFKNPKELKISCL
jgi:hypothetical protein